MALHLPNTPIVRQSSSWLCWAAAIQSWTKAIYNEKVPQEDLVRQYQAAKLADVRGGLNVKAVPSLARVFNMAADPPLKTWRAINTGMVTETRLSSLMAYDPVIVMSYIGRGVSHTVVVSGVEKDVLFYMDPTKNIYQVDRNVNLGIYCIILYRKSPLFVRSNWHPLLVPSQ
jgi:ABC-type bacteriocin/lantibiotic exporter with double-glycine peptidase domain